MASEAGRLNRLSKEKSPYLLQHARNPVDWYPWGEEAFEKAKKENKPIFLSGTACAQMRNWCMETEYKAEGYFLPYINICLLCSHMHFIENIIPQINERVQ